MPGHTVVSAATFTTIQPHYVRFVELIRARPELEIAECEGELHRSNPDYDPSDIVPRVIVWHNAVARIPFPVDLFCGRFDTHFGLIQDQDGNLCQQITFRGDSLPSSIKV
jgi:hypothetical protein